MITVLSAIGVFSLLVGMVIKFRTSFIDRDGDDWGIPLLVVCVVLASMILIGSYGKSYSTYVDARKFQDAVVEQYKSSVTIYTNLSGSPLLQNSLTDLKYQHYQGSIKDLIVDIRNKVAAYNEVVVGKRILKKSPFFSWLIYDPGDLQIIRLIPSEGERRG